MTKITERSLLLALLYPLLVFSSFPAENKKSGDMVNSLQRAAGASIAEYELFMAKKRGGEEPPIIVNADPEALAEAFHYFSKQPAFIRCQELLLQNPSVLTKHLEVFITNAPQLTVLMHAASSMTPDDYADLLLRCLEVGKAGKMTPEQWAGAMSGGLGPNRNILLHNFSHPKIVKICQTAPQVFKDPLVGDDFYKRILSGDAFKSYWETVEGTEGRKPAKVPRLKASQ